MPVSEDCPEPLKSALEEMETIVQSAKRSLAFAAPEIQDTHWAELQVNLAGCIATAIEAAQEED